MTTQSTLTITGVVLSATAGAVIGAILLYGIGYYVDINKIEKIVERWGHLLRIKKTDIHKANGWFEKYGYWTIIICRMIPLVRSLISIPAGMTKMNIWLFLLFSTIGTFIWNIALVWLGAILGQSWEDILYYMDVYSTIAYAGIGLGAAIFLTVFIAKRKASS